MKPILAVVVAVLLAVLALQQQPVRAQQAECVCAADAVPFCLPKDGVLVQRFAASAHLCEVKKDPEACPDGQARMCIPVSAA